MNVSELFSALHDDIREDRLKLPALPDVALRVQKAMADPDCDLSSIARLIQLDAGLSAYLLQIVNCPLYRSAKQVENLGNALARMGLSATKNYVMSYAMMALYSPDLPVLKPLLKQQWQFSTRLAAISAVLAKQCQVNDPDMAMLAGLMQDIGMLPLLGKVVEYPEILKHPDLLLNLLDQYAGLIGSQLLSKWQFDRALVDTARTRNLWRRDHQGELDYSDIVMIARVHALLGTSRAKQLPPFADIPAFRKLPITDLNASFSLQLLANAKDEVKQIQRSLGG